MIVKAPRAKRLPDGRRTGQKVRRGSQLVGRAENWAPFDKDNVGRYMRAAELYERSSRPAGQRSGILGPVGLEVLRELLRMVDFKTGQLDPEIRTICKRVKRCRAAVVRALKALKFAGFLDWTRRYKAAPYSPGKGVQVEQTSNAYRLSLPKIAAKLLGLFAYAPPESADLVYGRAQRAHQSKVYRFEDSRLGDAFARWASSLAKREYGKQAQSAIGFKLEVARGQEG
jgi:hypothetical protein